MNSNSGRDCARTHGAAHRSPIHFAQITTGVQRSFIAPGTHPRPTLRATTPPPPPRARTRRSRHARRCYAQCGASTASTSARPTRITPRLPPPDRPYDHGSDRAHDHALRAHTRTRRPRAQSTRSAHIHHALARTHAARHEHTHTPVAMIKSRRWVYSQHSPPKPSAVYAGHFRAESARRRCPPWPP